MPSLTRRNLLLASLATVGASAAATFLPGCSSTPSVYGAYEGAPKIPGLDILPRSRWTSTLLPVRDVPPDMGEVQHITVHHSAMLINFADEAATLSHLEGIRRFHTGEKVSSDGPRGWTDIAYHLIIDRAGRVWEGRALRFQGAHVKDCNANNLGVMCLGNFEDQEPSMAQWSALVQTLTALQEHFGIDDDEVLTHQEWTARYPATNTLCPGKNLQAKIEAMREIASA